MGRSQKRYDLGLLNEVIKRDSIIVDLEKIKKISSLVRLDFICKCGKVGNKTFRLMFEKGSMCRECTINLYNIRHKASLMENTGHEYALQSDNAKEKKRQTCIERFGFDNQMKSEIVKEKIKATSMERYGVEHCSQLESVKERKKETCMKHYGVGNPLQCPEIIEKSKATCMKRYGVEHCSQLENVKEKVRQTNLKRYGVTYAIKLQYFKEKKKETCMKKYGVTYATKLQSVKDKRTKTNLERYGVTCPMKVQCFKDKREKTCLEKYGETSVLKVQWVKNKSQETCMKKYGVRFVSQSGIQKPNKFEFKTYTFPCGNIRFVQGYEPFALDDLVSDGYVYSDILTARSDVPSIWYNGSDGKRHRYFVDIYIPKINKMIEVKSKWTYIKYYETVLLKAKECLSQGYDYEIWIYDYKRNKTVI